MAMGAHRHLDEKRLFALLDAAAIPEDAAAHLAECKHCQDCLIRLKTLRRGAIAASKPLRRDWSLTDEAIQAEIQTLCSSHRGTKASYRLPFALALATAAALVLALAIQSSTTPDKTRLRTSIARPGELGEKTARPFPSANTREDPAAPIVAQKWDAVPLSALQIGDRTLKQGETCTTGERQTVRISLDGGPAQLELEQQTALAALSLNIEDPQIFLERGTTDIDIPVESQIISLRVLADGADFLIDEAEVTFHIRKEGLEVIVHRGNIVALDEDDPVVLTPGRYVRATTTESGAEPWMPLPREFRIPAPDPSVSFSVKERSVRNTLRGHLPLSEVRQTMAKLTPALRRCYESALKRDSNLTLAMQARLKVARDGGVTDVSIDGLEENPAMARCVRNIFVEAQFRPPSGGPVRIVVPLKLYPRN